MRTFFTLLSLCIAAASFAQLPPIKFEQTKGQQTPAYHEIIDWWKKADAQSGKIKMLTMGMTDAG
ncbi:MAG TPA: hypothetical protein PKC69_15525, partial [Chitinophagaceae bacterium]|nr:hypothetical protein [Chitinophagaceae bacterium]